MRKLPFTLNTVILAIAIAATLAISACSGKVEPQARQVNLEIKEGKLTSSSSAIQVNQGDTVTLRISTDEAGEFHLHGYDIEKEVTPGETTPLEFTADATGRFNITFHPGGGHEDEEAHAALFESPTLNKDESFSFELPPDLKSGTVPFHNHMHHEITGAVTIAEDTMLSGKVEIGINGDGSFNPPQLSVKPGTTLIWVSYSDSPQRVTSGDPPQAAAEEEEEVLLGAVEVRPR